MKNFIRNILVVTSLLSIITTIKVDADTLAPPNVQLLGNANGLVHIHDDDLFLHHPNMIPGDSIKRTLEIKNKYKYPYELFLKAERVSPKEEYDLLDKLDLKITYKDEVIYEESTNGEDKLTNGISLGVFNPGQEENLIAEVKLDGVSTGNEYKNKSAQVDWIFTAVRSEEETNQKETVDESDKADKSDKPSNDVKTDKDDMWSESPKTGEDGIFLYIILGITSILLLLISRKNKDSKK
ncbi:LPXTG cell wall anchor domain-containing protein [Paraclostridium bifermentans]|uniref:LPXTG cell wall anchor domain-containing protein n=1 Tax=Paraclostridium bifermentans TaxID=1490 RepID=UPI001F2E2D17|nr:LPXTG cell wall anchor domain-containing protein [Paraclostridium bifermentans]MCE9675705.1 LPXTG cell wall anchor domain-containing protein [Paraclostridium bifermentans]